MVVMKKITKEEYINKHFNKKFKLIDDSCFKYVMRDLDIAKEVISCFDSKVYDKQFSVVSEAGAGTFSVSFGEMRVDVQILTDSDIYSFEAQNYKMRNLEFLSFIKYITLITNDYQERKNIIKVISDMKKFYLIVFDNCNETDNETVYEEFVINKNINGNFHSKYYKGKVTIIHLKNIDKNDKINVGIGDNPKKLSKFLLCFNQNGEDLMREEDKFMNEIGKKVVEFNNNIYERIAALETEYKEYERKRMDAELKAKNATLDQIKNENIAMSEALAKNNELRVKKDEALAEKDETIAKKDEMIAKNNETLAKNNESLIKSAKILKQKGLTNEEISNITSLSIEVVEAL